MTDLHEPFIVLIIHVFLFVYIPMSGEYINLCDNPSRVGSINSQENSALFFSIFQLGI